MAKGLGLSSDKEQGKEEQMAGDQAAFDGIAGDGLEGFTQDTVSTAYLGMVQPGSGPTLNGHGPGTWRNSSSEENYGKTVEVYVVAFKTVWTERDKNPPYHTVGRYEPKGIHVKTEYPKPGQRGFPKMFNPDTGNKVEELFVYACALKNAPEQGIIYFSPTVGSMKACKQWNAMLRSQRMNIDGKVQVAPIYGFSWHLELELVQNPAKPAEQIAKFVKVIRGTENPELIKYRQQRLAAAQNVMMLAAPESSGDADE